MTTPDFTDSFGFEYFNQRVACCTDGCSNEGVEVVILAVRDGVILCGVCGANLHELDEDEVVALPVVDMPVLEIPETPAEPGPGPEIELGYGEPAEDVPLVEGEVIDE